MSIINTTPYAAKLFTGSNQNGELQLTCVIKASFSFDDAGRLTPVESQIQTHDEFYDEPMTSSIQMAEESMPYKQDFELLLKGHIESNEKIKLLSITTEHFQKQSLVFGERRWTRGALGLKPSKPLPIQRVNLSYENTFGGEQYLSNPSGKGFKPKKDDALPCIENPKHSNKVSGFYAIARHWIPRKTLFTSTNRRYWHNCAPIDQQSEKPIRTVLLKGFYKKELTLRIPDIQLNIESISWDTLSIDLDAKQCHLSGRSIAPWHEIMRIEHR